MTTPALLEAIGSALFGYRWQTALSIALQVNERTVRRWAAGDNPMPEGLTADLRGLMEQRRTELTGLLRKL